MQINWRKGGRNMKISFYKSASGKQPVAEYLEQLISSKNLNVRDLGLNIASNIELLQKSSTEDLETTLCKKLKGYPLWEMKIKNVRIIYCKISDGTIFLLHIFTKKSNATPKRHIKTALSRYRDLIH